MLNTLVLAKPTLTGLPVEIIERIADSIRYKHCAEWEVAGPYTAVSPYFDFEEHHTSRSSLNSFSQVCKSVHFPAMKALYTDVLVDFLPGPEGRDLTDRLRLLHRSLTAHPDLGNLIRAVYLHCDNLSSVPSTQWAGIREQLQRFTAQVLSVCSNLVTLVVPPAIVDKIGQFELHNIQTLVMSEPHDMNHLAEYTPKLSNLAISHTSNAQIQMQQIPRDLRRLRRLRMSVAFCNNPTGYFTHALQFCGDTVRDLSLSFGSIVPGTSFLTRKYPDLPAGTALTTLRLNGIDALSTPSSESARRLHSLTSLRHLHICSSARLAPSSFTDILPPSLLSLTLSEHNPSSHTFEDGGDRYLAALAECLSHNAENGGAKVRRIRVVCEDEFSPCKKRTAGMAGMAKVCAEIGVPFEQTVKADHFGRIPIPDIQIFCELFFWPAVDFWKLTEVYSRSAK